MSDPIHQRIRQEFFKETPDGEDEASASLSLRSYLSRKMFETQQQLPDRLKKPELTPELLPLPPEQAPETHQGYKLNNYDTELSAGIEQYLPTAATRLRVTKERLVKEITAIQAQLIRYQSVQNPSEDVRIKIQAMQERLESLRLHEQGVDAELTELFSKDSLAFQISNAMEHWKTQSVGTLGDVLRQFSPEELIHRFDPQRYELMSLNKRLNNLKNVLQEQLETPKPAPTQISELVTQYDHALQEVQTLADAIRNKINWRERWSDGINRWMRKLYT